MLDDRQSLSSDVVPAVIDGRANAGQERTLTDPQTPQLDRNPPLQLVINASRRRISARGRKIRGRGIGTAELHALREQARPAGCTRAVVVASRPS